MRKKIFSARYPIIGFCHGGEGIIPELLMSEFLVSGDDRDILAARLIEAAKELSMSEQLDMDIFESHVCVELRLFLDFTLYEQSQMQAVGALLMVCDMLEPSSLPDRRVCLSLFFNKDAT